MIRQWVGSVVFTLLFSLSALLWSFVVTASLPFPRQVPYRLVVMWIDAMFRLLKLLCRLDYKVDGLENIPGENTVVLLKHSSVWETLVQFKIFPPQTWVIKREIIWAPFIGWAVWALRPIAINRKAGKSAVEQVIEQGSQRLADGLWVMIFPEGTRVRAGETRRYGVSGALLAQANHRPVLPVAHNAGSYWPRRGWLKRPGTIHVAIGPPIETHDRSVREINQETQNWIEEAIASMPP
jgi:1-acyl-sn-glycerol-3-phosphate acyltransferase